MFASEAAPQTDKENLCVLLRLCVKSMGLSGSTCIGVSRKDAKHSKKEADSKLDLFASSFVGKEI